MNSGLYAFAGDSATATDAAWANRLDEPMTNVSNVYFGLSRLPAVSPGRLPRLSPRPVPGPPPRAGSSRMFVGRPVIPLSAGRAAVATPAGIAAPHDWAGGGAGSGSSKRMSALWRAAGSTGGGAGRAAGAGVLEGMPAGFEPSSGARTV